MGMVIEHSQTGLPHAVQFQRSLAVSVVRVDPGTYRLAKFAFAGVDYGHLGEEEIVDDKLQREFLVEAGKAYYIGDFLEQSNSTALFTPVKWKLIFVKNNYEETTREFKQSFPRFSGVETIPASYEYP